MLIFPRSTTAKFETAPTTCIFTETIQNVCKLSGLYLSFYGLLWNAWNKDDNAVNNNDTTTAAATTTVFLCMLFVQTRSC